MNKAILVFLFTLSSTFAIENCHDLLKRKKCDEVGKNSLVYNKCCETRNSKDHNSQIYVKDPSKYSKEIPMDCNKLDRDDRLCDNNSEWNNPRKSCAFILSGTTCSQVPKHLHRTEGFKKCCANIAYSPNKKEECSKKDENTVVCRDDQGSEKVYVHIVGSAKVEPGDTIVPHLNEVINDLSHILEGYYGSSSGSRESSDTNGKGKNK